MNLYLTTVKKRQIAHWNCFCSILSHLFSTFRTYYYTVSTSFTSDFYWNSRYGVRPSLCCGTIEVFPTSSARSSLIFPVKLPTVSYLPSSATKLKINQANLPPSEYIWKQFFGGVFELFKNTEDTGIIIYTFDRLNIPKEIHTPDDYEHMRLKRPVFHIELWPNGDYDKRFHIVDMPTLKQAKELAELFYSKWLKANPPSKGSLS